jgi:hypothetical protein
LYLQLLNLLLISRVRKFLYICLILVLISFSGYCQILDDSTHQIYSSKTTQYFTLDNIFNNTNDKYNKEEKENYQTKRTSIDTSILNLHNYNYYFKNGILYQDLGNLGTPLNRIYYEPPTTIGKKLGFTTLSEYGYDPDKIKYYDTKSPYTKLFYIQGTRGQQSFEIEHNQNIKPNWNVGFTLKRMISLKQIGVAQRQEKQMSHYSFEAHTSYFSNNKRYAFLGQFTHMEHSQYENGGIFVDSTQSKSDMFEYKLDKVQLYSLPNNSTTPTHLRSNYKSSTFRFYNEYSLTSEKTLQVFHQFDYQTTIVRYDDDYLSDPNGILAYSNKSYYGYYNGNTFHDTSSTHDRIFNELYENKLGLKGSAGKLFYLGYLKRRDFSYIQTNYGNVNRKYYENYVGGKGEYRFTDTTTISAKAEYYIGRDYLFRTDFTSKFLDMGYNKVSYSPTLYQLKNISNSSQWDNNFSNTISDMVYASGKLKVRNFFFSPFANYTNVSNLIYYAYYNGIVQPAQSNRAVQMTSLGFTGRINWHALYFENYLRYTKITGADVWRAPELFNQGKVYLYGHLFKKALLLQIGVDLSWKSGYYGNAYSPSNQQFYLSDRSSNFNYLDGYLLADVYLNAQIKRGFVFLKLSHANMGLPKPGYFITPYYTGLPRSFEFGVKWLFYD